MSVIIALAALALLMLAAYRGYSVILFAPIAALGAVLLTDPGAVGPAFTGLFMEKMVGFVKLYFPVFLLGAVFGKLIELSGFSRSIVAAAIRILGRRHAIPVIVLVCALLTYGGVSLFVVAFAVYPFAAELFRQSGIPKRLIPATVALGAFSFTMDALPGTPQIQNIIPTSFFGTNAWAAPWLGLIGSLFIIIFGLLWLERQRRKAQARGEGYGTDLQNEPETPDDIDLPHPLIAIAPLLLVGVLNLLFTHWIPQWYGASHELNLPGLAKPVVTEVGKITAIWAVQAALLSGIVLVLVCGYRNIRGRLAEGSRTAVGGAILAAMNTASEYGFGAVIAALPGFLVLSKALAAIPNPLLNEAISVTVLAGITGYHDADLRDVGQIEAMMRYAESTFGGVDIVINNAGIQHVAPVEQFPVDKWNDILAINLSSVFHTTRLALPGMRQRNWGRIINIASVHGLVASKEKSAYVAAKHAVVGLTKTVALETARSGITCNAICPGWVLTPLVQQQIDKRIAEGVDPEQASAQLLAEKQPSGEFVTPQQLGEMALFLCSDAAAQVRGAAWNMDGGWVAQ